MKVKNLYLAILLGVFFTSGPVNAVTNPWGQYGQNGQNTGMSNYTGPAAIEYTWQVPLSADNSESFVSPVVDSTGTVFLLDAERRQSFYEGEWWVDDNGKWFYNYSGVGRARVKAISSGGGPKWEAEVLPTCTSDLGRTALALGSNGYLYVACSERNWSVFYALDSATGTIQWELQLDWYEWNTTGSITVDSGNNLYFVAKSSRIVDGGRHYYHTLTKILPDGTKDWDFEIEEGYTDDMAGPVLSSLEDKVYVYRLAREMQPRGAKIHAINTASGLQDWELELPWGGTGWQTETSFTVDGNGTIWLASYVKDDPDDCYGRGEYLIGIGPNGTVDNQFPFEGEINCGSHIRVGPSGTIYLTYDDTYWGSKHWDGTKWLYRAWDSSQNRYRYRFWDGTQYVYVDSPKGGLAAYDPVDGFKWRFNLPDSFEANASPAIDAAENIYFAASFGERLYSLDKDGNTNWIYDIAPGVEPGGNNWNVDHDQFPYGVAPVIGRAGSIYVMSAENLYAINNDIDNDSISNNKDNCLSVPNTDQTDNNTNGIGDVCDGDVDGDGKPDIMDNCLMVPNSGQEDLDKDGWGDACDPCEGDDPQNTCDSGEEDIPSDTSDSTSVSNITETATVTFEPEFVSYTGVQFHVELAGETASSNFAYGANQHNLGSVYTFTITPTPSQDFNFETVNITFTYDQGIMPEGSPLEDNLDIYYYNPTTLNWEPRNAVQDMVNNTLSTFVDHFSSYAIILTENPVSDLMEALNEVAFLEENVKNRLTSKLEAAYDKYWHGNYSTTSHILDDFITSLENASGDKLTVADADMLIQSAERVKQELPEDKEKEKQ